MKTGLLLVQLGSPRSANVADVRDYLVEFLGDPLVVQPRPPFWNLLLRLLIAPRRAPRSAALYESMLKDAPEGEMPLLRHTREFAQQLALRLGPALPVAYCFQYGSDPKPAQALASLQAQGCSRLYVLPLYPQRSGATTGAALKRIQEAAQAFPGLELVECAEGFATDSFWVEAQCDLIGETLAAQALPPTDVIFTLHGYPMSRIQAGDPYQQDSEASVKAIIASLKARQALPYGTRFHTAYQSRFGRSRWLEPSSQQTLTDLGAQQASVLVICPSFTSENLETLIEVDQELRDAFFHAGGRAWQRVPCLGSYKTWVEGFAAWALSRASSQP